MKNPHWAVALGLLTGALLAILFGADRARAAALVGFSDEPSMFATYGSDSVHAHATGARIMVGWNHDPSELTGAIEELGLTTPIITLYTISDVDPASYGAQCAAFARAWPHTIIQAGNEPNIHIGGFQPVSQVVEQVRACERAVHQVDPTRKVLGPSVAPVNVDDMQTVSVRDAYRTSENAQWHHYMSTLYDQLPSNVGTAMNIYPYGQNPVDKLREDLQWGKQFRRPVWVTETAMLGDYGRKKAAKLAARSSRWLTKHGARSVFFHRLAQGPVDPIGWKTYAINAAGERTALYKALRREWAR